MKPSLKLTNAIHILIYFNSKDKQSNFSSKEIAASVNTNPSRIRALMAELQNAEIIKREGDHFSKPVLARAAKEITLADILRAVEPNAAAFPLDEKVNEDCPIAQQVNPVLAKYYEQIDQVMLKEMASIDLESILEDVNWHAGTSLCKVDGANDAE